MLHEIMSCWTSLFRGPKMAKNSTKMALYDPKWPFMTQNDASLKSLHDPKCPFMTQNAFASIHPNLHQFTPICINLHHFTSIYPNLHQLTSICINLPQFASMYLNLHQFTPICINWHHYFLSIYPNFYQFSQIYPNLHQFAADSLLISTILLQICYAVLLILHPDSFL